MPCLQVLEREFTSFSVSTHQSLSTVSMLFEVIFKKKVVEPLHKSLWNDKQYMFLSALSSADILKALLQRISQALDSKYILRKLYILNTFDKVWHKGLVLKLSIESLE